MNNLLAIALLTLGLCLHSTLQAQLPISENFDSYGSGETMFADWDNTGSAEIEWQTNFGGTPSFSTGPLDDVTGGGAYIYMETSSPVVGGDQAVLRIENVLVDGATPALKFNYHMFGAAIGNLEVNIISGGSSTTAFSQSGDQQPIQSAPFIETTVPLISYLGQTISIEIIGTAGVSPTGIVYTGDIALDNIFIGDVSPSDAAVSAVTIPGDGCSLSAEEPVVITVTNVGGAAISSLNVAYWVTGIGGVQIANPSVSIAPGESEDVIVKVDLSAGGTQEVNVDVRAPGDADVSNGLLSEMAVSGIEVLLPILDDLESYSLGDNNFNDLLNINNGVEWQVNNGGTPSSGTGPSSGAFGSGQYIYMETSSPVVAGAEAILRTPCINLDGYADARLEFDYHMYGSSIDFLSVEVIGEMGRVTELFLDEQQQSSSFDPWLHANIDLTAYVGGRIQIILTGRNKANGFGDTYQGDISLDNLVFDGTQINADLGAVDAVADVCSGEIEVTYTNLGVSTVTSADLSVSINGGDAITQTVAINLLPGQSDNYTFTGILFDTGANDVVASAVATGGDGDGSNDAFGPISAVLPGADFAESFNSYANGTTDVDPFKNLGDLPWEVEYDFTASTGTGPADDVTGGGGYLYMETSSPAGPGDQAVLEFCTDLGGLVGSQLIFSYHMYGSAIGSLEITVNGNTEATLTGQQQFSNLDPWQTLTVDLSGYDGMLVTIRMIGTIGSTGSSYQSDISLDEIRVIGNVDEPIPVSWTVFPGISSIRYKIYDYTKSTPVNPADARPVLPDTNYLGEEQDIYVVTMVPFQKVPQTDTMIVFVHGGGFRAGEADNLFEFAIDMTQQGYTTVLVEYPRGYIEGDTIPVSQLTNTELIDLFCNADSTAFRWAAGTATSYTMDALDFVKKQGVGRFDPATNQLVEVETASDILGAPFDASRNRPGNVLLWGTSAGGSIVYNMILKEDAAARWDVAGAAIHAGAMPANETIDYTNTPILCIHNNEDPRAPFTFGRPYELEIGCTNFPIAQGSRAILEEYQTTTGAAPFMLVNTCGAGHGYGVYSEAFMAQGLVDFLKIAPAWGTSEITIIADGGNNEVYSLEIEGDCP